MVVVLGGDGGHGFFHVVPNATQRGRTALIRAALAGRADCVRVLLEGGANKDAQDVVRDSA